MIQTFYNHPFIKKGLLFKNSLLKEQIIIIMNKNKSNRVKYLLKKLIAIDEPNIILDIEERNKIIDKYFVNRHNFLKHIKKKKSNQNRLKIFHLLEITMLNPSLKIKSNEYNMRITKFKARNQKIKYYILISDDNAKLAITHYLAKFDYVVDSIIKSYPHTLMRYQRGGE